MSPATPGLEKAATELFSSISCIMGRISEALESAAASNNRELWFTFHGLGEEDVVQICTFLLQRPHQITRLNLNGNEIKDSGAIMIANIIPHVPSLVDVNLAGNSIGDAGCIALCKSLEGNRNIVSICLLGNMITDEGGLAVAKMLEKNSYLQYLYLYLNQITDVAAIEIAKAVAGNKHLSTLWLDHNPISLKGTDQVANIIIKSNRSLSNFEMTVSGGESLSEKSNAAIKIMQNANEAFQNLRRKSAMELLIRRRVLLLAPFPFPLPVEILHKILFTGILGFDSTEEAIIGYTLLNRRYIGKIVPLLLPSQVQRNLKKASGNLSITGNELVRRCETIFLSREPEGKIMKDKNQIMIATFKEE